MLILGAYEVGREIGSGAMGSVHIAYERDTGTPVALKRIHPKYSDQQQALLRFAIEVKTAARLRHPNIVSVVASGSEARGTPWCAMEWVSGHPLSCWSRGRLSWSRLRWILSDLLDALAYAHARGVVHRDLKPANLLVEDPYGTPRLRLVDFGIARVLEPEGDEADAKLTMDDRVIGTPAYLSPEQAQGFTHLIGPHTDLYAVGVMIYEMVSGRLPFDGLPIMNLLMAHVATPPPTLDLSGRPDMPRELVELVRWSMEKGVEARPQVAQALKDLLILKQHQPRKRLPRVPDDAREKHPDIEVLQAERPASSRSSNAHNIQQSIDVALGGTGSVVAIEMVGRDVEYEQLVELGNRTSEFGQSHLVLVHGDAGLGKTKLVKEVRYALQETGHFRGTRILCQSGVSQDETVRAALARLLYCERLKDDALRKRLQEVGTRYELSLLEVQALTAWFTDEAASDLTQAAQTAATVFRRIAALVPLVVIVEGVDSESASFATDLVEQILADDGDKGAIYLLATARVAPDRLPPHFASTLATAQSAGRARVQALEPLPDEVLVKMVEPYVGVRSWEIAGRARGNPLFALELARYAGQTEDPAAAVKTMPMSIADIWKKRIDETNSKADNARLSASLLVAVAILGPSVRRRDLLRVACDAFSISVQSVTAYIHIWIDAEVLTQEGGRVPIISFVHNLAYEYVAENIDSSDSTISALVHHIARWVAKRRTGINPDVLDKIASLLTQSGHEELATELGQISGELLVARLDFEKAINQFRSVGATALRVGDRALQARAGAELARVFVLRREFAQATACLQDLENLLEAGLSGAERIQSTALIALLRAKAALAFAENRLDQAADCLGQAAELAKRGNDAVSLSEVRTQLSQTLERQGRMADAERECRLAIQAMEESEVGDRVLARAHITLARLCRAQGRIAEAREAANEALPLAEAVGDHQQVTHALQVLVALEDASGDYDRAGKLARRVLELQLASDDRVGQAESRSQLGVLESRAGHLREAEEQLMASMRLLEHIDNPQLVADNHARLGALYRRGRKSPKAINHLRQAERLQAELGQTAELAETQCRLAGLLREEGRLEDAEKLARTAYWTCLDSRDYLRAAHCQVEMGLVAADRRNWGGVRENLSEARSAFADMDMYAEVVLCETWLALATAHLGDPQQAEMMANRVEERLRAKSAFTRALAEGLQRLSDGIGTRDQQLAWRLQDRARHIQKRLHWRGD